MGSFQLGISSSSESLKWLNDNIDLTFCLVGLLGGGQFVGAASSSYTLTVSLVLISSDTGLMSSKNL